MKVTDNLRHEPFTHQRDMKPGDVFSWNGQPMMIGVYVSSGTRYLVNLGTGDMNSAKNTENEIVVALPNAEVLLHGVTSK